MRIEECLPCPRCGYKRIVQLGRDAYVCFQCRYAWSTGHESDRLEGRTCDDLLEQFSPELRARLIAYRGAVRAGVYTDRPPAHRRRFQTSASQPAVPNSTPQPLTSGALDAN
jgi:hypothetical protein